MNKKVLPILFLFVVSSFVRADLAKTHLSGQVEFTATDFGSLAAIRAGGLATNFKFPKDSEKYYLGELSEIWIGDAKGTVAAAWNLSDKGLIPGSGNFAPSESSKISSKTSEDRKQIVEAQYNTSRIPDFPLNLLIDQKSFSWSSGIHSNSEDFIVINLTITNSGDTDLTEIYVAMATNWNVDDSDPATNPISMDWVDWHEEGQMLFTYDGDETDGIDPVHVGTALIDGDLATAQIFPFIDGTGQMSGQILTNQFRSMFMSNPFFAASNKTALASVGMSAWDYTSILSAGPYNIPAGKSTSVTFALVAGEDREDIFRNVAEARRVFYAPQNVTSKVAIDEIALTWAKPIYPIDAYEVWRRAESETEAIQVGPKIHEGTKFIDREVQRGIQYFYTIRSVRNDGTPIDLAKSSETSAILSYGPQNLKTDLVDRTVFLSWEESPYQATRYRILRSSSEVTSDGDDDGDDDAEEFFEPIGSVLSGETEFGDSHIEMGMKYRYKIQPLDRKYQPLRLDSEAVEIVPIFVPEGLSGNLEESKIRLQWQQLGKIEQYRIYRNHTGSAPWTLIARVPADKTNFIDQNVYPGFRYFYAIGAENSSEVQSKISEATAAIELPEISSSPFAMNLDRTFAYPNPYRLSGDEPLIFQNLPRWATIKIYNVAGDLVQLLKHDGDARVSEWIDHQSGIVSWNGRNAENRKVAPGVYIYQIETVNELEVGSFISSGKFIVVP